MCFIRRSVADPTLDPQKPKHEEPGHCHKVGRSSYVRMSQLDGSTVGAKKVSAFGVAHHFAGRRWLGSESTFDLWCFAGSPVGSVAFPPLSNVLVELP